MPDRQDSKQWSHIINGALALGVVGAGGVGISVDVKIATLSGQVTALQDEIDHMKDLMSKGTADRFTRAHADALAAELRLRLNEQERAIGKLEGR